MSELEVINNVITVHRSAELDTVDMGADGRTLVARLLRWNTVNEVSDDGVRVYRESWLRGSFARTIETAAQKGKKFPLFAIHPLLHPGTLPIGASGDIVERDDGPWMTAKISKTTAGDEMIELIRDGAVPGVSVGARILKSRMVEGVVQRVEAALNEVTLTAFPALEGAEILALRSALKPAAEQKKPSPLREELQKFLAERQRP